MKTTDFEEEILKEISATEKNKTKKIPLIRPFIDKEELEAVWKVFQSGYLAKGPTAKLFESEFTEYLGIKHASAVSSCTTALHLALVCLGIGPGDEVIVPDFTYPATGHVVFHVGAKPILVDIDLKTFNLDPAKLEDAITENTKSIIVVHLFGYPAEMSTILEIAEKYDLSIIEDAACAIGTLYKGKKAGTFGDIGCFSFHARKLLTTGEGGMLVTDNDEYVKIAHSMKDFGIRIVSNKVYFTHPGFNYRLSDVLAAIGRIQLKKIDKILEKRKEISKVYTELLSDVEGIIPPHIEPHVTHTYQSYVILLDEKFGVNRDKVIELMAQRGIESQIGTYSLHLQPCYKRLNFNPKNLINSSIAFRNSLTLPLFHHMTLDQVEFVANALKNIQKNQ
ncbi:DegT/DnrJ/EryC1/StrS family aminotransferase [Candidatus Borrarchaeum sp.]|uniref:DegT/DnrJ/EryC1/StrS family aminotransferase n=1 Tax=Candidatus Borrarchaeum sp. TaxID=2846742 RepID=UPI00257D5D65|nr:DegT/DnrJ/EryC1/StrS family aminotransferase [Candidatus Borrarchaeum sp.]